MLEEEKKEEEEERSAIASWAPVIKNGRPDKEGLGAGVKSGSTEGSRMHHLIYGPFRTLVCFKCDLVLVLTLTRFLAQVFLRSLPFKKSMPFNSAQCSETYHCVCAGVFMMLTPFTVLREGRIPGRVKGLEVQTVFGGFKAGSLYYREQSDNKVGYVWWEELDYIELFCKCMNEYINSWIILLP